MKITVKYFNDETISSYSYFYKIKQPELVRYMEIEDYDDYVIEYLIKFINLKILHLNKCEKLISLPILNYLTELEVLNCENLYEINSVNLKSLKLSNCKNIYELPDLNNLVYLNIFLCENLVKLPKNLNDVECVYLHHCPKLKNLPLHFYKLKKLDIEKCPIEYLPSSLYNLKELNINTINIRHIPDNLLNLNYLEISFDRELKDIPLNLINLKRLILRGCDKKINISSYYNNPNTIINIY